MDDFKIKATCKLLNGGKSTTEADFTNSDVTFNTEVIDGTEGLYRYIGTSTVSEINALDVTELKIGYTYNVSDSGTLTLGNVHVDEGDNVAWTGTEWDKLASTIDLTNYYQKNANIVPSANNTFDLGSLNYTFKDLYLNSAIVFNGTGRITYSSGITFNDKLQPTVNNGCDLGTSSYKWKDLYLSGSAYIPELKDSYGNVRITINSNGVNFNSTIIPSSNNARDLGGSSYKWKDLYLSGNMYGTTYSLSIDNTFKSLFNYATVDSATTQLGLVGVTQVSLSANRTFTLASVSAGFLPEYKAILTNSGSSAITITLPSGIKILTNNDEDIVITDNTFVMSAGITCELNIMNNSAIVVVF